eukprot:INCI20252.1.p2 GENE.INCI20252.1~~INCI20252.1.p2  ORF type:complete len:158 (-),score=22.17 INCI20252.1:480-953(-)
MAKYEESAFKAPTARPINRSFDWMGGKGSWFVFVIFIGILRYLFSLLTPTDEDAWNYTFYAHCLIQFYVMHWIKGTMDASDQGRFMDQTWWEQIDGGIPWTSTRKFLVCLNIVLFLVVSKETSYDETHMLINGVLCSILTVAKLPEMQGVRIFGINK